MISLKVLVQASLMIRVRCEYLKELVLEKTLESSLESERIPEVEKGFEFSIESKQAELKWQKRKAIF